MQKKRNLILNKKLSSMCFLPQDTWFPKSAPSGRKTSEHDKRNQRRDKGQEAVEDVLHLTR